MIASVAWGQSIDERRAALERAQQDAKAAMARSERMAAAATSAADKSAKARAEAAAIAAKLQASEASIEAAEERVALIDKLQERQAARLAERRQPTARLAAGLVTMARRPAALALLQPGSMNDLVHIRLVLASAMPVVEAKTADVRRDLERSRALRADAGAALAERKAAREQLGVERQRLAQAEAAYRREANALGGNIAAEQDRALAYGEQARDLSQLLDRFGDVAAVNARLEALPGPIMRPARPDEASAPADRAASEDEPPRPSRAPYRLPVIGRVVSGTGEVSASGLRTRGLAIETRPRALVVAPTNGRIAFAGPFRAYGNIVIVDHGAGWTTLITGLGDMSVRAGDVVDPGGPLGKTRDEAGQIMVELRRNGAVVDIARLIGEAGSSAR
jgi:murein hydrolase activator